MQDLAILITENHRQKMKRGNLELVTKASPSEKQTFWSRLSRQLFSASNDLDYEKFEKLESKKMICKINMHLT